jgi:hypothetical protein
MPVAALAMLFAATAWADELDDLARKVDPPARFKDHKANWSIKEQTFTYWDYDDKAKEAKADTCTWYVIHDGDTVAAAVPRGFFQSGQVYIYDFRPGRGPKQAPMPTERFHIETERGSGIRTDAFIPSGPGTTKDTYDFKIDGNRVILTRRYSGTSAFNKWSHSSKTPVKVEACNTAVLAVDPRFGYTVDITFDAWCSQNMTRTMYIEAGPAWRHSPWPDEVSCYRLAVSRVGREGFEGYPTNMGATLQHRGDFVCRNDGIMAFLNDQTGWSPTYTNNSGVDSTLVVCGPHTDLDVTLDMTKVLKERKDDMNHYVVRHRMVGMPPEMTKYVWDNMKLLHQGEQKLLLRMGRLEDFEEQPLDVCTSRQRGVTLNGNSTVSDEAARSGRKSLKFTGTLRNGNPTLCVRPDRKYRIEAWMKVSTITDADRAAAAEKAKAAGKPAAAPAGEGQAYMTLAFAKYDMDAAVSETMKSNAVKPSAQWQHVTLDFTSPKWGPSLRLGLVSENCVVYLDDFKFAEVK